MTDEERAKLTPEELAVLEAKETKEKADKDAAEKKKAEDDKVKADKAKADEIAKAVAEAAEKARLEAKAEYDKQIAAEKERLEKIKQDYISEENRKKIEKEEAEKKAQEAKAAHEKQLQEEREKFEKDKLELEIKQRNIMIIEVADELNIPKNLRKYILGNTKEECMANAKTLLQDLTKSKDEFDKAVQKAVEEKFKQDGHKHQSSTNNTDPSKMTLAEYSKMSTLEKLDFKNKYPEQFAKIKVKD